MKLVFSELPTGNIMQNTEDYSPAKSISIKSKRHDKQIELLA